MATLRPAAAPLQFDGYSRIHLCPGEHILRLDSHSRLDSLACGAVFSFIGLFSRPRGLAIAGVIISLVLIPLIVTVLIALNSVSDILFYDTF